MCGITGLWNFREQVNDQEFFRFTDALEKRGPDYGSVEFLENRTLALGHRRLSILDLSENGNQPMKIGKYTIVFNGEIFNYIELRNDLIKAGYSFRTKTDTEVVVQALDFWGKDALNKFNGMWAFALWDEDKKELFISRDRFGIKPIYYSYEQGNYFVFASQTVAFKQLPWLSRNLKWDSVQTAWKNPYMLEGIGETIFENTNSLLPGHNITLDSDGRFVKQERWWYPDRFLKKHSGSYKEQLEQYRELFIDACKLRLRSDVPLASALSGGVDSSAVYSTICHIKEQCGIKNPHKCFIGSFPHTEQDETYFAKEAVQYANGEYKLVTPDINELLDEVEEITEWYDGLNQIPLTGISEVYGQMRKEGYIISLDGHGPDELFFGYHDLMEQSAEYAIWNLPEKEAIAFIDAYASRYEDPAKKRAELLSELAKSKGGIKGAIYKKKESLKLKNQLTGEMQYDKNQLSDAVYNFGNLKKPIGLSYENYYLSSLPGILKSIDHISMFSSIEVRSPFMDHRLVSFSSSLPLTSRVGNGYNKRIIRESMEGIMSPEIINRTSKRGFGSPLLSWVRESKNMQSFLMDHLHSDVMKGLPIEAKKDIDFQSMSFAQCAELWKQVNLVLINK